VRLRWKPTSLREYTHAAPQRLAMPLRRRYYMEARPGWIARLPVGARRRLSLEDDSAVGTRKVELGPGERPQQGYLHVDTDPWAQHVELLVTDRGLPLPDDWAEEILAIHVLEHVPPAALVSTLEDWHRCLRSGGFLQVHVPDSRRLCRQFADERDNGRKWALMGALLGMYATPRVNGPTWLSQPADHQIFFDEDIVSWALGEAGFARVENLTGKITDVHTEAWSELVPNLSLIFRAHKA
jgi:hypothetical protein